MTVSIVWVSVRELLDWHSLIMHISAEVLEAQRLRRTLTNPAGHIEQYALNMSNDE